MGKIVKLVKVLRNNWKKSLLGAGLLAYGVDYGVDSYNVSKLMRAYCKEAVKFGNEPAELGKLRRITVILNPAANNKKAKKNFDSYCAPLLHLSGVFVDVLETKREGHARELIDDIEPSSDAIVIAGGDGTLSETVTGLMRTRGELCKVPIGVLPLGSRNSVARALFQEPEQHNVAMMANATMAVVKGKVKPVDAYRVEALTTDEGQSEKPRPVYGVGSIEWGLRRELRRRSDSLWWMGPLKDLAALVFHGPHFHIAQNYGFIEANIRYSPPCKGCSNCFLQRPDLRQEKSPQQTSRWWNITSLHNRRMVAQSAEPVVDYATVTNEACRLVQEKDVVTSDLNLVTNNLLPSDREVVPKITVKVGPTVRYQGELLTEGFKILKDEISILKDVIEAKQVEIRPSKSANQDGADTDGDNISIDNEDFDVRPIRVSILPNSVKVFCK